MTRSDLIEALAQRKGLPLKTAEQVVNLLFEEMRAALQRGERIEFRGFGSFKVREYKGYIGRNPRTGRRLHVHPKRLPVFKISRLLHEQLNSGLEGT